MLEVEKEFQFFTKKSPEPKVNFWRNAFLCFSLVFAMNNLAGLFVVENHNDKIMRQSMIINLDYEYTIDNLNNKTYKLSKLKTITSEHEFIKDLKRLASYNSITSDWYVADLMLQIQQDKTINNSVKEVIFSEYRKFWDNGFKNEKTITSPCFLNYPCALQKHKEQKTRKAILDGIKEKQNIIELLRQTTKIIPDIK